MNTSLDSKSTNPILLSGKSSICQHCEQPTAFNVGGLRGAREIVPVLMIGVPLWTVGGSWGLIVLFLLLYGLHDRLEDIPYCKPCRRRAGHIPLSHVCVFFATLSLPLTGILFWIYETRGTTLDPWVWLAYFSLFVILAVYKPRAIFLATCLVPAATVVIVIIVTKGATTAYWIALLFLCLFIYLDLRKPRAERAAKKHASTSPAKAEALPKDAEPCPKCGQEMSMTPKGTLFCRRC